MSKWRWMEAGDRNRANRSTPASRQRGKRRFGRSFVGERLESRRVMASDYVASLPGPGTYELATDGEWLELRSAAGVSVWQALAGDVSTLTVLGTSGDDTLVISETAAGLPQFSGDLSHGPGFVTPSFLASGRGNSQGNAAIGIHFEAFTGENTLMVALRQAHDVGYYVDAVDATGGKRGNVNVDGQFTLSFAGLTPQVIPGLGGTLTIDLSNSPDNTEITLRDDPANLAGPGGNLVVGNGGFETTLFAGFTAITISGGPRTERYILDTLDGNTSLTKVSLVGGDLVENRFEVRHLLSTVALDIVGGNKDDLLLIDTNLTGSTVGKIQFEGGGSGIGDRVRLLGAGAGAAHFTPDTLLGSTASLTYGPSEVVLRDVSMAEVGGFADLLYESRNPEDVISIVDAMTSADENSLRVQSNVTNDVALLAFESSLLRIDLSVNDNALTQDQLTVTNTQDNHGVVSVLVSTGDGPDTLRVNALAATTSVGVDLGSGNDMVIVGNAANTMQQIVGALQLVGGENAGGDTNTITIDAAGASISRSFTSGDSLEFIDSGTTTRVTYELSDTRLTRGQSQDTDFSGFEFIQLDATSGRAVITVSDTPSFSGVSIVTRDANDDITVDTTGADSIVSLTTGSGDDTIVVQDTGTRALLGMFLGSGDDTASVTQTGSGGGLLWQGQADNDAIAIDATGDNMIVDLEGGIGADQIIVVGIGLQSHVELAGEGGADELEIVNLPSTGVASVLGGDDDDLLVAGGQQQGSLDGLLGTVTFDGGNNSTSGTFTSTISSLGEVRSLTLPTGDRFVAVDSASANAASYELTGGMWTRATRGLVSLAIANTESYELMTTSGPANVTVTNTPASSITSITSGDSDDTVQINGTGTSSYVSLSANAGSDSVATAATGASSHLRLETGDNNDLITVVVLGANSALRIDAGADDDAVSYAAPASNVVFAIQGNDGNDLMAFQSSATPLVGTFEGNGGNDIVSLGGLASGARVEARGGNGDDTFVSTHNQLLGIAGNLTFDGEADADQLVLEHAAATADHIYLLNETTIQRTTVPSMVAQYRSVEAVELNAGSGADQISVLPSANVEFSVDGGAPTGNPGTTPGDQLDVDITGLSNPVIPSGVTMGAISADGVLPVNFTEIELVGDSILDDQFESNNTLNTASQLPAALNTTLVDLTLPTDDRDYFELTAFETGYITVRATWSANSAPVSLRLRDANDLVLSTVEAGIDDTEMAIPVLAGKTYRVDAASSGLVFNYTLAIVNTVPMAPFIDGLVPPSDSGVSGDNTTNVTSPTINIDVDLAEAVNRGIALLSPAEVVNLSRSGFSVGVVLDGQPLGFATHAGGNVWSIELPTLADGTHRLTTSIVVVDVSEPREQGLGGVSAPYSFIIDTTPPVIDSLQIDAGADTGFSTVDRVTSTTQIPFSGRAEAGALLRILATNVDSGEEVAAGESRANDSGVWQITTTSLANGHYRFVVQITDVAGNVRQALSTPELWIDSQIPTAPVLDLVSDNGDNTNDNRTSTSRPTISIAIADPATSVDRVANDMSYNVYIRSLTGLPATRTLVVDSLAATGALLVNGTYAHTLSLTLNSDSGPRLPSGTYEITADVQDRAGNEVASSPLTIVIEGDDVPPPIVDAPDLLALSDTGMRRDDDVTQLRELTFVGVNEVDAAVTLFVQPLAGNGTPLSEAVAVATTTIGNDASDGVLGNDLGAWQLTTIPLADGRYAVFAVVVDSGPNTTQTMARNIWIDTSAPGTPLLDLLSDSGRSNSDNITNVVRPTFAITPASSNGAPNAFPNDFKYRVFVRPDGVGSVGETLLVDSFAALNDFSNGSIFTHVVSTVVNNPLGPGLPAGTHNFRLEVEDRAGNISPSFLLDVTIDTIAPQVTFGTAAIGLLDGLRTSSDTGNATNIDSFADRLTSDVTPTFWGEAEANALVTLSVRLNDSGTPGDLSDDIRRSLGDTIVVPTDGNIANPRSVWEIESTTSLNDTTLGLGRDGRRQMYVVAEDLAGNRSTLDGLPIFLDTSAPVVQAITYGNDRDVLRRDASLGPSPLPSELRVTFVDPGRLIERTGTVPFFPALAVEPLLGLNPAQYQIVGDATGVQTIRSVRIVSTGDYVDGVSRFATVALEFTEPLPDDRYTLTILDDVRDPAGNRLDGDMRPTSPGSADQLLPSGDGIAGGNFVARFTVDARPEIGAWAGGSVAIDTNGNWTFDPANVDHQNRDQQFTLGFTSDDIFAGQFTPNGTAISDGFDRLAAYGDISQSYGVHDFRWLIDLNNDGVVRTSDGDLVIDDPANINGLPVAGNFDGLAFNGDEVGVFTGSTWWIDTNHDYRVDRAIPSQLRGLPVVGDFNGDHIDDLATYFEQDNQFQISFGTADSAVWDGNVDLTFRFGFLGVRERPAAADFDRDGIDDLVLWSPDRSTSVPRDAAEWYLLLSGGRSITTRVQPSSDPRGAEVAFAPVPAGTDRFALFGDDFALPVVGNFYAAGLNLPVATSATPAAVNPNFNSRLASDVNNDGFVSPLDAVIVINELSATNVGSRQAAAADRSSAQYWDTNNDGMLTPLDAMIVINALDAAMAAERNVVPRASLALQIAAPATSVGFAESDNPMIDAVMQTYGSASRATPAAVDRLIGTQRQRRKASWR